MNKSERFSVIQIGEPRAFEGREGEFERCLLMNEQGEMKSKYYPKGVRKIGDILVLQDTTYNNAPATRTIAVLDDATITAMKAGKSALEKATAALTF